ncbi:MAG: tryptophan synthase subunit beta, partial [Planctomycetota bacterium]
QTYLLQDENGQIHETECISAGLDYPGVGPEHAYLKDSGRATYTAVTNEQVLDVFELFTRSEGIIPALESSHALAWLVSQKGKLSKDTVVVVNLSGRGDKDVSIVEQHRPML